MRVFRLGQFLIISILLLLWRPISESGVRNRAFVAFTNYLLSPSALPGDPRVELARVLFDRLAQQNPDRFQAYSVRVNGIADQLRSSSNQQYFYGRMELQQAREAESLGKWSIAIEHYHNAIDKGTEQVKLEANLLLAELSRMQGDQAGFEQAMQAVSEVSLPLSIPFVGCSDLELLGGYIDERDLELDRPVHIVLVWKGPRDHSVFKNSIGNNGDSIANGHWRFFSWRDQIFQVGLVDNLVSNGGFEQTSLPQVGGAVGYRRMYYRTQEWHHNPIVYKRTQTEGQTQDMALELHGKGQTMVGLESTPVDVPVSSTDVGYLVAGWYQTTEDAVPKIGIRWLLKDAVVWDDNISSYAVTQPSAKWSPFARLTMPPDSTAQVRLWVLNINEIARLQVDNLGLFRVPLPCLVK